MNRIDSFLIFMKEIRYYSIALMLLNLLFGASNPVMADVTTAQPLALRCGWLSNPTPANISLYDRDGEWIIGVQGAYQMPGDWDWPKFKPGQWVESNVGGHGYGCVCLHASVNPATHQIMAIKQSRPRPLSACRKDPLLQKWKDSLE